MSVIDFNCERERRLGTKLGAHAGQVDTRRLVNELAKAHQIISEMQGMLTTARKLVLADKLKKCGVYDDDPEGVFRANERREALIAAGVEFKGAKPIV